MPPLPARAPGRPRATRPEGVLAFHTSNRYYDLEPAIASAVESLGLTALVRHFVPSASEEVQHTAQSQWLVASRDAAFLARLEAAGWEPPARRSAPLTDDHPDITRLINLHR